MSIDMCNYTKVKKTIKSLKPSAVVGSTSLKPFLANINLKGQFTHQTYGLNR